ncbi:MAG: CDP-alcohol phosphatidyltransferase family protein [Acidimicrobiales bacterium]
MFDGRWRASAERALVPVGSGLERTGVNADQLTALGLLLAVGAAAAVASGRLVLGAVLLVASALPDLLDGAVAKAAGTASPRGAFFDSVADRVSDSVVLGGVAWHLSSGRHPHLAVLALAVVGCATLISYERAKAESLGMSARGGLMERAERIAALSIGLLLPGFLVPVLWIMLALTAMTAVQRFAGVWRQASAPRAGEGGRSRPTGRWRTWRPGSAWAAAAGEATSPSSAHGGRGHGRWRMRRLAAPHAGRSWRRRVRTRP